MTNKSIIRPPAGLFNADTAAPNARTMIAEVRTDSSLPFDPKAAPNFLHITEDFGFGAFIQWRVEMSWSLAEEVQVWLSKPPAEGVDPFTTQEAKLKNFFENINVNDEPFLEYLGTFLATGTSSACYTLVVGMLIPHDRQAYQIAFKEKLDNEPDPWAGDLKTFLKLMLNQPSSREEYLTLARNARRLAQADPPDPEVEWPPMIKTLIG